MYASRVSWKVIWNMYASRVSHLAEGNLIIRYRSCVSIDDTCARALLCALSNLLQLAYGRLRDEKKGAAPRVRITDD
ncbi:hypothetical protein EVAR_9147_1 [Eumeta japonica]|uniref:Uncharacterized protein n=1 Tax=Eumeta variegata TaxID=151549 RepID=A0A4C1TW70_EUMVA|nr:hypothetical protein EVAR_9147_1 [Eumeta japonica]